MIMRAFFVVFAAVWIASAAVSHGAAEDYPLVGRPLSGVTVKLGTDGKISVTAGDLIVLDGGRELRRVQGDQYKFVPKAEMETTPFDISGLDLLLHEAELVDHRVRVTDGVLFGADVGGALLRVQGGSISLDFKGANKDSVKAVVSNCHSIGSRKDTKDKCAYGVVGTVTQRQYTKGFQLTSVVLELSKPPD